MRSGLLPFVVRRLLFAALLVFIVSSGSLLLVDAAPGDHFSSFDLDAATVAAERHRHGLDRPMLVRYGTWLSRAARFDFGESMKYRRPVAQLVLERAPKTALLGAVALTLATLVGVPMGILTGSRRNLISSAARTISIVMISVPSLVTSFGLLFIAARTGWLPVGGFASARDLIVPAIALALPIAATLERLQSEALSEALAEPSVRAALARGCSPRRAIWHHAFRLSLTPVLAIYGAIVGTVLSGSFAVEIVTSWPGLGALMYDALVSRDLFLVAGCAGAGAVFLAVGTLASDVALAFVDPRITEAAPS